MLQTTEFGAGDAIAVVDARLRITEWNPAAEALTGIPSTSALGEHCWQVLSGMSDDDGNPCQPGCLLATRALRCGDVPGRSVLIRSPAGSRRIWLTTLTVRTDGRSSIVHVLSPCAPPPERPSDVDRLTEREREVLALLGEGLETAAIADRLGISVSTVRTHIRHILATFGVRSQLAAVTHACARSWS